MNWKPKRWIAITLGFFLQFFGLLYVGRYKWAIFYFLLSIGVAVLDLWLLKIPEYSSLVERFPVNILLMLVCAVHAGVLAGKPIAAATRPWYSRRQALVGLPAVLLITIFTVRSFFYEPFRIPAGSMLPGLEVGDHLLIQKWPYGNYGTFGFSVYKSNSAAIREPERGDIFVFDYPADRQVMFVKRIIGLPGDTIVYENKQLFINGSPVEKDAVTTGQMLDVFQERLDDKTYQIVIHNARSAGPPFRLVVPENSYFVMGDNRDNSSDSRHWGVIAKTDLVGKVVWTW